MVFVPARQRYMASKKPNALPTELCERCFQQFSPTFELKMQRVYFGVVCAHERKMLITMHFVWEFYN